MWCDCALLKISFSGLLGLKTRGTRRIFKPVISCCPGGNRVLKQTILSHFRAIDGECIPQSYGLIFLPIGVYVYIINVIRLSLRCPSIGERKQWG